MDFSNVAILCIGDVMLDRFVQGEVERISPEAPVPVIRATGTREMLGGAGNVALNIAALGGQAILVGLVGRDEAGAAISRLVEAHGGMRAALAPSAHRPTICKTRFVAGRQQVVRADEESRLPLQASEEAALLAAIEAELQSGRVQGMVLSDYGKGVLSPAVIALAVASGRSAGVAVFVDPKSADFATYRGATCITPNERELSLAARAELGDEASVVAASRRVMAEADAEAILATRSEKGMVLVERSGEVHAVPARAREVFDVSGAGDTVIATMALAHAAGRTLPQAMRIANAAAGVVVSKLGTATAGIDEVVRELAGDETPGAGVVERLASRAETVALVAGWKAQGLRVGFTNGCFDLVHAGHVALLSEARAACDRLVVALNDDAGVRRLKGAGRPVNALAGRARVIAAMRHVDCVVAFAEDTPLALIEDLLPDVLVKGADYTMAGVVGAEKVLAAGGRVVLAGLVAGESTTSMIARAGDRAALVPAQ